MTQILFVSVLSGFSRVHLFATLRGIYSSPASLSMGFSKQEYWSGFHFLHQGIFLTQGLTLYLLCLQHCQAGSLPLVPPGLR